MYLCTSVLMVLIIERHTVYDFTIVVVMHVFASLFSVIMCLFVLVCMQ